MARIEITLSRTHKIAERLKARATELCQEALVLGSVTTVQGLTGAAHVARLGLQGVQAMELSGKAERYLRVTAAVRAIIARENQARGINELLGQLDAVNRLVAHKKSLLEQAKTDGIDPSELEAYKPLSSAESRYSSGVSVNVLGLTHTPALEASLTALQREAFQLSDRIAEANAARLALELDDDIAAEVTGA